MNRLNLSYLGHQFSNLNSVVESRDPKCKHFTYASRSTSKNGASSKSHTSRVNQIHHLLTVIFMTAVFFFSSCASIVTRSIYPLSINSTPSDAKISITDKKGREIFSGHTPAAVQLSAGAGFFVKAEYQVKFSSPGYEDKIVPITFSLDGWYFGNIFFGGLIGMLIVDPATGAMWKIDTRFLNEKLRQSTTSNVPEMKILDVNEIPENWKGNLVKLN